jgi:hypothetical protein
VQHRIDYGELGINSIKYTGMSVAKASEIKNTYHDSNTGKWKIPDFEQLHLSHLK